MQMGIAEIVILGLWLVPLVLVVVALIGNRPRADRFFAVNGLDPRSADVLHVDGVLRRTRRARVAGAGVGLVLGGVTGASLGTAGAVGGAGMGLLAGTMLGITVAQPRPQTPTGTTRTASLIVRDATDYLPRRARTYTSLLAGLVAAYVVAAIVTAPAPLTSTTIAVFVVGIATLVAVPVGRRFQQRTVELRRPDVDSASVRVDDALRASALRGIHHATIGVLFCGLLLVAYGAIAAQNVGTVRVGDEVVLRAPSISMQATPDPFVTANPVRYRVEWTDPGGDQHRTIVVTDGRPLTVGSMHVGVMLGLAFWISLLAFLGVLVEWSRAAKAWRRPQTTPSALGLSA